MSQAQLTWTPSQTGITEISSYDIYRSVDGGAYALLKHCPVLRDFLGGITGVQFCTVTYAIPTDPNKDLQEPALIKQLADDSPVTYVDTTVVIGHSYCYFVQANPMGNNQSVAQGPPSQPSNTVCFNLFQATAPVLSGNVVLPDIVLTWTASTIQGSTIANYQVFRNVDGGAFSLLTTVGNVLTYTDPAPTPGHTYGYHVVAVPVAGVNSPNSNEVDETISGGPSPNLVIRSTAGAQIADVAAGGAPGDQILGDFSTILGHGAQLYFRMFDAGPDFVMQAFCAIPQLGFTSIEVINVTQTFTAASANFSPGCGFNSWTWPGRAIGVLPSTVYNMLVTP